MSERVLIIEKSEGCATLTLNRPDALNALNRELGNALTEAFRSLKDDPDVGVIIVTGAGRGFCSGLDLKELSEVDFSKESTLASEDSDAEEPLMAAMREVGRPIIAAINGVAITGGFELALSCDILISSTEAKFADTHARVGILPGWGLSQKLSRLIGIVRTKELSLTGNYLSAEQAERWGVVSRVVKPDDLMAACRSLAKDMLSCAPGMVMKYKALIDEGYRLSFGDAMKYERNVSGEHARRVTADLVALRREAVKERGRRQKSGID